MKYKMQNGGMIKRADGSYSKRGLWDNVRANKGSGKKPTSEMLKQERKINKYQQGGNSQEEQLMQLFEQFAMSVEDDDFNTGEDVYNEYNKLNPQQQQQFIQSIQQQSQQQAPQQEAEQAPQEMQQGGMSSTFGQAKALTRGFERYNAFNVPREDSSDYNSFMAQRNEIMSQPQEGDPVAKPIRNAYGNNNFDRGLRRRQSEIGNYFNTTDAIEKPREPFDNSGVTYYYNKQTGGIPTNENGYYELDPEENPIARIPSSRITMKSIPYEIQAVGGTTGRDYGMMQPDEEYDFEDEEYMYEIPKAQGGGGGFITNYRAKNNLELKELETLRSNRAIGYSNGEQAKRFQELDIKHRDFNNALRRSDNKTANDMLREQANPKPVSKPVEKKFSANEEFERNRNVERLNRQKAYQESMETTPKSQVKNVSNQGTVDEMRFRNSQAARREAFIPDAFKKISDGRVAKRDFTRGVKPSENILTKTLSYGKKLLNNPVVKGLTLGAGAADAILSGVQTKQIYDDMKITEMLNDDKSETGKRYRDSISTSNKIKNGTKSVGNFFNTGTGQYESDLLQQYLQERQEPKKINSNTRSVTRPNDSVKPAASTNARDFSLYNDMDKRTNAETNIPFMNRKSVSNSIPVEDNSRYKNTEGIPGMPKDYFLSGKSPVANAPVTNNEALVTDTQPTSAVARTTQRAQQRRAVANSTEAKEPAKTGETAQDIIDYYNRSAKRLPDNIGLLKGKERETSDIKTGLPDITNIDKYISKNSAQPNNGFIGSKPVTINYDNPDEARAIQYRKMKSDEMLAPYRGGMTIDSPELYQESATPYLDNIRENRNAVLQQVNSNTSTGQAALASMYGQGLNQENQAIGEVSRNNAQNTTQFLNQRADVRNKQQQFDNQNDNRYYGDVAQLQANKDEEDVNYMNSIANFSGKRIKAKNELLNTAIMTGLPDDALHIGDEGVTFDVGKIPHGFYDGRGTNKSSQAMSQQKEKSFIHNGMPHAIEYDENGTISGYRAIPLLKSQSGGMTKYNFRKQKSQ